mgnify:CR=1 FL=1
MMHVYRVVGGNGVKFCLRNVVDQIQQTGSIKWRLQARQFVPATKIAEASARVKKVNSMTPPWKERGGMVVHDGGK